MIAWGMGGKIVGAVQCCAVLCATVVHSCGHTHMDSSYRCFAGVGLDISFWVFCVFLVLDRAIYSFCVFWCILSHLFCVVSTSASDCLERLVPEMTC